MQACGGAREWSSSWDYTRQPLFKLRNHNRNKGFVSGPKATKSGAPHHRNVLIVGPFARSSKTFVQVLCATSRKFHNRLVRGIRLAQIWHLVDPLQTTPLRIFCPDATYKARAERACRNAPSDEKQMMQLVALSVDVLLSRHTG